MKTKEQQREILEQIIARLRADPVGERAKITKMVADLERELAAMGRVKAFVMSGTVAKARKAVDALKIELVLLDAIDNGTLRTAKDTQGRPVHVVETADAERWFGDRASAPQEETLS